MALVHYFWCEDHQEIFEVEQGGEIPDGHRYFGPYNTRQEIEDWRTSVNAQNKNQ